MAAHFTPATGARVCPVHTYPGSDATEGCACPLPANKHGFDTHRLPNDGVFLWPIDVDDNARWLEAHLLDAHREGVSSLPREDRSLYRLDQWHRQAHDEGRTVIAHDHVWRMHLDPDA